MLKINTSAVGEGSAWQVPALLASPLLPVRTLLSSVRLGLVSVKLLWHLKCKVSVLQAVYKNKTVKLHIILAIRNIAN